MIVFFSCMIIAGAGATYELYGKKVWLKKILAPVIFMAFFCSLFFALKYGQ